MMATLACYEGFFGPYHPHTLALTLALAVALGASGSVVDGARLLERAVADLTKHHGKHHPVRIRALEELAKLLCREANWIAALPVQQELLECRSQLLGREHPDSVAVRNDLSMTLCAITNQARTLSA